MSREVQCNDPLCPRVRAGEEHSAHDTTEFHKNKDESIKKLIDAGGDMTGGVVGAALGLAVIGPPGAIVGAFLGSAAGHAIKNVGNEIAKRFLSPREEKRIGRAIILASESINEKLQRGQTIREDDFFEEGLNDRSAGEEIVEAVLLAAQREYEERKIPYYSNLLANIVFSPAISRAHANHLISLAQRLTYRQLCMLSLFSQKDEYNLRKNNYREQKSFPVAITAILTEMMELDSIGLISSGEATLGLTDLTPGKTKVQGQGENLFKLMQLRSIDSQELEQLAVLLR